MDGEFPHDRIGICSASVCFYQEQARPFRYMEGPSFRYKAAGYSCARFRSMPAYILYFNRLQQCRHSVRHTADSAGVCADLCDNQGTQKAYPGRAGSAHAGNSGVIPHIHTRRHMRAGNTSACTDIRTRIRALLCSVYYASVKTHKALRHFRDSRLGALHRRYRHRSVLQAMELPGYGMHR